ncbi:GNAT family N-acetyltransferase [Pseudoalteromonas fuliginea]|uniref:N-acetyltransferase domain-containing protein n=1 Tax=Pseudoalteromonas fuliginea TaxID=1872678 RepID=A0ABD3YA84_9GAMM|nr:GNAT family N-acetyltransferase [Pseudoalteromonas fuliginea]KDC51625.1 hypothetical protein DC53_08640 [Pseudoalteromonas fuliginea]
MNKVNVVIKPTIIIENCESVNFPKLRSFLSDVSTLYPNFDSWLNFKVRRNIDLGTRSILLAYNSEHILGAALLKTHEDEKKISTFYVAPEYRDMGIGSKLMDKAISQLDSDKTFITVSNERQSELSPLLQSKGFELVQSIPNLYRQGSHEYFYKIK